MILEKYIRVPTMTNAQSKHLPLIHYSPAGKLINHFAGMKRIPNSSCPAWIKYCAYEQADIDAMMPYVRHADPY